MVLHGVHFPEDRLAEFCRAHRVSRLALFGSILRDDFTPESDVDILIEFEAGVRMGLFEFMGLAIELEGMIGRKVDLRGPEDLSFLFRERVVRESRVLHAA